MLILALDTTTRSGSAAVVRDDAVLSVIVGDSSRTHGERLPAEIERAAQLADIRLHQIDLLVVASGPGAFTGLRIGLATIQGLAMVLGRPTIGVSALDALATVAANAGVAAARPVTACVDAQRHEIFVAHYDLAVLSDGSFEPIRAPEVGSVESAGQSWPRQMRGGVCIGDGAIRYREPLASALDVEVIAGPEALAPMLARLGQRRATRGGAGPPHALQPLYVRRSDAELERLRAGVAKP